MHKHTHVQAAVDVAPSEAIHVLAVYMAKEAINQKKIYIYIYTHTYIHIY